MSEQDCNVWKWNPYHGHVFPYGPTRTYELGAEWLSDQTEVEDWGCGPGFLKTLLKSGIKYVGIDGSLSPNADKIVDLVEYRSWTPSIFMRHVLEHNWDWKKVLQNALASFENKFFLVLFTPFTNDATHSIRDDFKHADVPDLSFNAAEFTGIIETAGCQFDSTLILTGKPKTQHGLERFLKITRKT